MTARQRKGNGSMSPAELMAELQRKPELADRRKRMEEERLRNAEVYRMASRGVLADLAAVGLHVASVGELRKLGRPYPEAVPVLVRWLRDVVDPSVRQDIIRTLSVPWAREAAGVLLDMFDRMDDASNLGLRWAIGNAIEVLASDDLSEAMIRLATDSRYGRAREMIVLGLGKLEGDRVIEVLLSLLGDEEVVGHAVMALGRLRARLARSRLESLLDHRRAWIRKEAKKAIASIDKLR